jgi:hypothetical protein
MLVEAILKQSTFSMCSLRFRKPSVTKPVLDPQVGA